MIRNPLEHYIPEPNSGCHLWLGGVNKDGYAVLHGPGRYAAIHRMSYEAHYGVAPGALDVLHKCDVPSCINPKHLFLGTNLDNIRDRHAKGRNGHPSSPGERNGQCKLTEIQVLAILADGRSQKAIADEYGVHRSTIGLIKRRKKWAHLSGRSIDI